MTKKPPKKPPKYKNPKDYYTKTPPGRSGKGPGLRKVAETYNLSPTTINARSKKENWVEKRKQFWLKTDAKTEEKIIEAISDMNVRHLRQYKVLQDKGLDRLEGVRIEKDRDAISAVDIGIKGERVIRGEPSEVAELDIVFRVKEYGKEAKEK